MALDKVAVLGEVKILLGIADTSKDGLLNLLIDKQTDFICSETNQTFTDITDYDTFPAPLVGVLEELVIMRYRLVGFEGKVNEKIGDYSVGLMGQMGTESIPKHLLRQIWKYRVMRVS